MSFSNAVFIVFLSEDWDSKPCGFTRKRLLIALAKEGSKYGINVICVDRPVTPLITLIQQPYKLIQKIIGLKGLKKAGDGLYLYTPFILFHERLASLIPVSIDVNRHILRNQLEKCLELLGMANQKFITWIFHPYQKDMASVVKEDMLIYECHDDYAANGYVTDKQAKDISNFENIILKEADLVFTTAKKLYNKCSMKNNNTYYIPNAVDYDLFASQVNSPQDISLIPKPRLIYIGEINQKIDFQLVTFLAKSHPEWNIVFIGAFDWNRLMNIPPAFQTARAFPNVRFLGIRPYESIPGYLQAANVLILPFIIGDAALESAYPLKLNEYLASGNPIVSTRFCSDMDDFEDVVKLVNNMQEFKRGVEESITSPNLEALNRGKETARKNSWVCRSQHILDIIKTSFSQ